MYTNGTTTPTPSLRLEQHRYDEVAAMIAWENGELDPDEVVELFQHLIDSGVVWSLQGAYGRAAQRLLDLGLCHPPRS
jgi:hypothetical protein